MPGMPMGPGRSGPHPEIKRTKSNRQNNIIFFMQIFQYLITSISLLKLKVASSAI